MVIASTEFITSRMGAATSPISSSRMHSSKFVPIGNQVNHNTHIDHEDGDA